MPIKDYTKEEISALGEKIYQEQIKPLVEPQEKGKFVVIDIESGDYEVDREHLTASRRLRERRPDSVRYVGRIGFPTAYRMISIRVGWRRQGQKDTLA